MRGAQLAGQSLEGEDYAGTDLLGSDLSNTNLSGADFSTALLEDANMQGARLRHARLRYAILDNANLTGADLWGADLVGASLVGADLTDAQLQDADFTAADLGKATIRDAKASQTRFSSARLDGVDLRGTEFHRADLRGASLRDARLDGVVLESCDVVGAHWAGAILDRTRIRRDQLGSAIGDEKAQNPAGAALGYLVLERNFRQLGDVDASRWAYLRRRRMQKCALTRETVKAWRAQAYARALRSAVAALRDEVVELVCDYGESFARTVSCLGLLALTFAIIYALTGAVVRLDSTGRVVGHGGVGDVVTMTLIGMVANAPGGDIRPTAGWVYSLIAVETLLAVMLTGLLGFVIGNRIRR